MKITIKIIGSLIQDAGFNEKVMEFPAPTTVEKLLDSISISRERPKIITRNGRAVAPQEELADGDRIVISPISSGG